MAVRTDFVAGEVLAAQDLDDTFAAKIDYATPVNTQTGTTYTFVLADGLRLTTASNASASTFTIPPQSSVVWLANSVIRLVNFGAGAVTINGGSGVTVTNTAATVAQFQSVDCIRTGSNAWTVVVAGGGDEPGLVHINTTTFSAVSSVSVNNVFTATFDNYEILFQISGASNNTTLTTRLRVAGVDASGATDYVFSLFDSSNAASTGASGSTGTSGFNLGVLSSANSFNSIAVKMYRPNLAVSTLLTYHGYNNDGTNFFQRLGGARHNLATAFDGFSTFPNAGTLSGVVRIYGYKNS